MSTWVSFAELKQKLSFEQVLQQYRVEIKLRPGGKQHQGFCPLPTHNGQKRSPSFSVNFEKNQFHCFGCNASGNVIEFAARMEGLDPEDTKNFRKVALDLQKRYFPGAGEQAHKPQEKKATPPKPEPAEEKEPKSGPITPALVNAPLDFELKGIDPKHPYLLERGFTAQTIAHFGLGFCTKGSMQGRAVIPIHNTASKLIGYAGRLVDDAKIGETESKYRLPGKREHKGKTYQFSKSLLLYNLHRITRPAHDLIVVEGFPSIWWLWQAGFPTAVALMGSDSSDAQASLIVESVAPEGRVWIFTDGDRAGTDCAESVFVKVAPHRSTRLVKLEEGKQPTDCSPEHLATLFASMKAGGQP